MGKRLNTRVEVDGTWYGPDTGDVPDDVAAKITNPKLWVVDGGSDGVGEKRTAQAGTRSGARLARYVEVGGVTYGPDDPVPDEVAEQVTNPGAWVDRRLPAVAARAVKAQAAARHGAAAPSPHPGIPLPGADPAAGEGDGPGDGETPPTTEPPPPEAPEEAPPVRKTTPKKATATGA